MQRKSFVTILAIILIGAAGLLIQRTMAYAGPQSQPSFAKNLQVLKFVKSKEELKGWMNMVKTSLGVDCDYCHNTDNFASDEKPTKRKARMMLKMLVQVRNDYFAYPDAKQPTCYTCHQGHKEPASEPEGGFKSGD
ncbi:MAG TPA: c-type cytochrome [Candidatus Acidoferrales bacterium]|nr:c-type cytochrome [Candidatus Acidoferrales bacterium]